ncbi:DgyrCDS7360 [Dimorphilus gyrociliatus]|uniref:palmitoyl-CoA hydrolase n=1 Tax=Dimorphilus gyrociliatus TaxID=2664684 RepID=A0A7I8VQU5_9ANNE|nr:DgyrCDS7360 [Dimorphilus gyrociliatus]
MNIAAVQSTIFLPWFMLAFFICFQGVICFRPIVLVHGILNGPAEFKDFLKILETYHPGTPTVVIDAYNDFQSFDSMWLQLHDVSKLIMNKTSHFEDGYNLLCFSQGGLLCRSFIQSEDKHRVRNFISLSSPQGGQYGNTVYIHFHLIKEEAYRFFYTLEGQRWSVGNYWNDPHHHEMYLKYNTFLPKMDNSVITEQSAKYKRNLLQLNNFILIGGPDDGVITPWQSSQFSIFDENEQVVNYKDRHLYKTDAIGLKTLEEQNKLHFCTVPGVFHTKWHGNLTVFKQCIEQWLD